MNVVEGTECKQDMKWVYTTSVLVTNYSIYRVMPRDSRFHPDRQCQPSIPEQWTWRPLLTFVAAPDLHELIPQVGRCGKCFHYRYGTPYDITNGMSVRSEYTTSINAQNIRSGRVRWSIIWFPRIDGTLNNMIHPSPPWDDLSQSDVNWTIKPGLHWLGVTDGREWPSDLIEFECVHSHSRFRVIRKSKVGGDPTVSPGGTFVPPTSK